MNMAFSATIQPMREFRKTVTRRYGWYNAKAGDILQAVEKAQGLKRGEKVQRIHEIQLLTPRWERTDRMTTDPEYGEREVILEGFPELSPKEFVDMLCEMNKKRAGELVHRLEFRFLIRNFDSIREYNDDGTWLSWKVWKFEYQEDGTLAGKCLPPDVNQYSLNTYRFDL